MLGIDITIEGPFSEQHPLTKTGCAVTCLSFVLFGNSIPLAMAAKLVHMMIWGPAQPDVSLWGWLLAACFLVAMIAFGTYCLFSLLDWFTTGRLSLRQRAKVVMRLSLVSLTVAVTALVLGRLDVVFASLLLAIPISLILAGPLIMIGQSVGQRGEGRT